MKLLIGREDIDVNLLVDWGMVPLACAVESGDEKIVKLLLAKGANISAKDHKSRTPLYIAAEHGYLAVAKLLPEQRAEVNSGNDLGHTPLSEAMDLGHGTIVKLLLEWGPMLMRRICWGKLRYFMLSGIAMRLQSSSS